MTTTEEAAPAREPPQQVQGPAEAYTEAPPEASSEKEPTAVPASYYSNRIVPSPWISIPAQRFVCVEHPARVKNLDKAIATLGGEKALAELAATNGASGLSLRFRPEDAMQPAIESRTIPTNNVLLKVTIPRRRRKRKEGQDMDIDDTAARKEWDSKSLLEKMKKSKGNYNVEAIGRIERTVRFRDMANYQWNTARTPFAQMMKETLLPFDYESIRKFKLDQSRGINPDADFLPPPAFSNTHIPHLYNYRQNPAIKKAVIGGKEMLLNIQAAPKTLTPVVHPTHPGVPSCPPVKDTTIEEVDRRCVAHLRQKFRERPIWSRRALYNFTDREIRPWIRFNMVHAAYMFRSGPWRDTCVAYGIDPRTDPQYRKYQSIQFQVAKELEPREEDLTKESHIFDGKRVLHNGRCYQLCDITDPLVKRLVDTEKIRSKCDPVHGWYLESTMNKIKVLMKVKFAALREGRDVPDSEYLSILEQESEDEDGEEIRIAKDAETRAIRGEKKKLGVRQKRHGLYGDDTPKSTSPEEEAQEGEGVDHMNVDQEEGDTQAAEHDGEEEEEEVEGEWEEALDVDLTASGNNGGRASELVTAYNHAETGAEDEEGDFDHLEDENDNEGGQ